MSEDVPKEVLEKHNKCKALEYIWYCPFVQKAVRDAEQKILNAYILGYEDATHKLKIRKPEEILRG